jgi:hypothetical protein
MNQDVSAMKSPHMMKHVHADFMSNGRQHHPVYKSQVTKPQTAFIPYKDQLFVEVITIHVAVHRYSEKSATSFQYFLMTAAGHVT